VVYITSTSHPTHHTARSAQHTARARVPYTATSSCLACGRGKRSRRHVRPRGGYIRHKIRSFQGLQGLEAFPHPAGILRSSTMYFHTAGRTSQPNWLNLPTAHGLKAPSSQRGPVQRGDGAQHPGNPAWRFCPWFHCSTVSNSLAASWAPDAEGTRNGEIAFPGVNATVLIS
jgi:hypothetical protein